MGRHPRSLPFRKHLVLWRARVSIPSLLAGCDERRVIAITTALNGGIAILIICLLAWLVDLPLLFPALGPSAFLLFSSPFSRAASPRSVILGHFVALASGLVVWHSANLLCSQPISLEVGGWPALVSASTALALTCALLVWFSCPHAPACATALIIALGAAADSFALLGMVGGVLLLTGQAVLINRMFGLNTPTWSRIPKEEYQS